MSILDLFCSVDNVWQWFAPKWDGELLASGQRQRRRRAAALHPSELMTIVIAFHQSQYRTFKAYYREQVQGRWQSEFPHLVSYPRFVALLPTILVPLTAYLQTQLGTCTGVSFVDSTPLAVCHNARIAQHRVLPRARHPRQDLGRLVLWLQAAPGGQRPWGTARLLPDPGQCGRPSAGAPVAAPHPAALRQTVR